MTMPALQDLKAPNSAPVSNVNMLGNFPSVFLKDNQKHLYPG
jgi:hypothetical protein